MTLTVLENQSLPAGAHRLVIDNGDRTHSVAAGSTGQWSAAKRLANFGNMQAPDAVTVTRFTLVEPCADATLIVDGVTDNAGAIVAA